MLDFIEAVIDFWLAVFVVVLFVLLPGAAIIYGFARFVEWLGS